MKTLEELWYENCKPRVGFLAMARILKPGGHAVFSEPVRDSWLVQKVRDFLPWEHAEVSPGEYPLTTEQINRFAAGFSMQLKYFHLLPTRIVDELMRLALARLAPQMILKADRWCLDHFPPLQRFATKAAFRMDM